MLMAAFTARPLRPKRRHLLLRCVKSGVEIPLIAEQHSNELRPVRRSPTSMSVAEASEYTSEILGPWRCIICQGAARAYVNPFR
jgi:hypothetical protein